MNRIITIAFVLVVLISAGYLLWAPDAEIVPLRDMPEEPKAEAYLYRSSQYGFSFTVPADKKIHEYTPESIAIGQPIEDGFDADAEVSITKSEGEGGYKSFEAFLFDSVRNMCAADGPNETIYCTQLVEQETFETDSGLSGIRFYTIRIHENFATNESEEEMFGPFVAFNIQANTPDSDFSALIIRPTVSKPVMQSSDSLVEKIAESIEINLVH